MAAKGHTILVVQGLRTYEEQAEIYAQGRTKPGKIVTWAKPGYSWHNFGLAFDIVPIVNGKADWDSSNPAWAMAGQEGQALGMIWGGSWTPQKRDMPHFEFPGALTLAQARQYYETGGLPEVWKHVL